MTGPFLCPMGRGFASGIHIPGLRKGTIASSSAFASPVLGKRGMGGWCVPGFITRGVPAWWQSPAAGILGEFTRREDPELRWMQCWLQTSPDAFMCRRSSLLPTISAGVREHHRHLQIIKTKRKHREKRPQEIRLLGALCTRTAAALAKPLQPGSSCACSAERSWQPQNWAQGACSALGCLTLFSQQCCLPGFAQPCLIHSSGSPETFAVLLNPNSKIMHYWGSEEVFWFAFRLD